MIRMYDIEEIKREWLDYTEGIEGLYKWSDEIADEVAGMIEQSRWEASKGRMEVLTIREAVEMVCDAM